MSIKRALVWFKTDLRLEDNECLVRALSEYEEVISVYCLDKQHVGLTPYGFLKTGSFRMAFLMESLKALDKALRSKGSGLLLLQGDPREELVKTVKEYGVRKVFAKKEVAPKERRTEEEVEKALWKVNCHLERYSTSTLYHAEDLPFGIRNIPDVFTAFRKKVEKEAEVRSLFPAPSQIPSPALPAPAVTFVEQFGLKSKPVDPRAVMSFKGGEAEAQIRLNHYLFESHAVSSYKQTRNRMLGADYSSKLSPWLALGCISPRQIFHALKQYEYLHGANESTYWLVFELLWRDYFRFMMKKYGGKLFQRGGIKGTSARAVAPDPALLQRWINGETGVELVDANMRELKSSGFMSNRGRQNVASYFIHDLQLDWRYGAAYFEQELIDYDPCSNWGNWAYLAGVGNDPRADRYFNLEKQTQTYDPDGSYRRHWLSASSS